MSNVLFPTTPCCKPVVSASKISAPRQTVLRTENCESCAVVSIVVHPTLQCHPTSYALGRRRVRNSGGVRSTKASTVLYITGIGTFQCTCFQIFEPTAIDRL